MNLQHAVQYSLNVSLARLHTNKPAGTHGLTPTPAYFNIIPALLIRTKNQKNVYLCQLRVLVLKRAAAVRTIESFLGVRIN